jgi:hypothetical protein
VTSRTGQHPKAVRPVCWNMAPTVSSPVADEWLGSLDLVGLSTQGGAILQLWHGRKGRVRGRIW